MKVQILVALLVVLSFGYCSATFWDIFDDHPISLREWEARQDITAEQFFEIISKQKLAPKDVHGYLSRVKDIYAHLSKERLDVSDLLKLARYPDDGFLSVCNHKSFREYEEKCNLNIVKANKSLNDYCRHCIREKRKRCINHGVEALFESALNVWLPSGVLELISDDSWGYTVEKNKMKFKRFNQRGRSNVAFLCNEYVKLVKKDLAFFHGEKDFDYWATLIRVKSPYWQSWQRCNNVINFANDLDDDPVDDLVDDLASSSIESPHQVVNRKWNVYAYEKLAKWKAK